MKPEVPLHDPEETQGSKDALQSIARAAAALSARLKPLASVKPSGPIALRDLERALDKLGDSSTFSAALSDTVDQGRELVRRHRAERASLLQAALAGFIRELDRDRVRETQAGWRIGPIELEVNREEGTARASYDRAPMTGWTAVQSTSDVRSVVEGAEAQLRKSEVPEETLVEAVLEAFRYLSVRRDGLGLVSPRTRLADLLVELRIVLARKALHTRTGKGAEDAIRMPQWAVLYNIDRYRSVAGRSAQNGRLLFETGSQKETASFGVTLNGLDPNRDYERLCFVRQAPDR